MVEQRRQAVAASAAVEKRLTGLTPVLPADPMNVIIDRVTFIRSFADAGVVTDSQGNSAPWSTTAELDAGAVTITNSGGRVWELQSATQNQSVFTATA